MRPRMQNQTADAESREDIRNRARKLEISIVLHETPSVFGLDTE